MHVARNRGLHTYATRSPTSYELPVVFPCVHCTRSIHGTTIHVLYVRRTVVYMGVQTGNPAHMHDQYVVQYANSPYELYAEFGIN